MNPPQTQPDTELAVVPSPAITDAPAAYFHQDSETVRFWLPIADGSAGASVRSAVLRYRFRPAGSSEEPAEIYACLAAGLGAAVQRRVAQGSIEPVMLREFDLRPDAGVAGPIPA